MYPGAVMAGGADGLWEGLVAAARGEPSSPMARAALTLSADDGQPCLGWVTPVPWNGVEQRLAQAQWTPPGRGRLLIAATGGWAFAARAVAESAGPPGRLTVADTLDAPSLARVFAAAACRHEAAAITISASGQTYETRLLAHVISLAWGSRAGIPHPICAATVPGGLSLTPKTRVNALFGAPLSVPFALAGAAIGTRRFRAAYASFAEMAYEVGRRAAALACAIPLALELRLDVVLPAWAGEGIRLWALQALRQGLGGRPHRPIWSEVRTDGDRTCPAADPAARRLDLAGVLPAGMVAPACGTAESLAAAMTVMYATAVFTACLGIRTGIVFTSHPAVRKYKMLLNAHPECAETMVHSDGVTRAAAQWLTARTGLAGAHLVWYISGPPGVTATRLTELTGLRWEVHAGSRWNHHSYQAVHGESRLGVVAVVHQEPPVVRTGDEALDAALRALNHHQASIARATCASLENRALLVRVAGEGMPAEGMVA
jgi:hypothetical protein